MDTDNNGTLSRDELQNMTNSKILQQYDIDWDQVIVECDYNGDGVIDF